VHCRKLSKFGKVELENKIRVYPSVEISSDINSPEWRLSVLEKRKLQALIGSKLLF
jgi:hypothetical protein